MYKKIIKILKILKKLVLGFSKKRTIKVKRLKVVGFEIEGFEYRYEEED